MNAGFMTWWGQQGDAEDSSRSAARLDQNARIRLSNLHGIVPPQEQHIRGGPEKVASYYINRMSFSRELTFEGYN